MIKELSKSQENITMKDLFGSGLSAYEGSIEDHQEEHARWVLAVGQFFSSAAVISFVLCAAFTFLFVQPIDYPTAIDYVIIYGSVISCAWFLGSVSILATKAVGFFW